MFILNFKDQNNNSIYKKIWINKKRDNFLKKAIEKEGFSPDKVDIYMLEKDCPLFNGRQLGHKVLETSIDENFTLSIFEVSVDNLGIENASLIFKSNSIKIKYPYKSGNFLGNGYEL